MWPAPLNPPVRDWSRQRVWIIGASSGIGAALAHRLLDKGAEVVLSARRQARLEEVAGTHPRALVLPHDVTDPASWRQCWAHMREQKRLPDLIVFCAADYRPEQSWQLQHERVRQTLDTNLAGVYFGLETILPDLMVRQSGGIVLVASVAGYIGLPGACVYGPGKAALINLAELLHAELRQHHLGVYLVNPGFVSTRLTALNDFSMPAIISPDDAAAFIVRGLERGRFEIHFPRRFTLWIKLIAMLPYRLRLPLLRRLARN
ncbi:SDR family NAD(P)-dependent oxidoreductase [Laribacter hongkongensis]|uniref:SDR family NAD(P)-dependent oxidoreductase n=1 Tax=Laribacter hongkongensis TaxID=168471 RepID=UPI001EFC579C|nr:SDR family NAD(P)-dependent oxidoreductase [Laribacter hongkongensis]MCG9106111.1 SDR family NAD(P)-dependent oxidoreductase [Laribacter hongkongensis]